MVGPDTSTTGGIHTHQLLVLLPGETYIPGKISGTGGRNDTGPNFTSVLGHAVPLTGDTFPVTVVGTDRFYNKMTDNPQVIVGANATLFPQYSPSASMVLSAGSNTITAAQIDRSTTSASFFVNQVSSVTYNFTGSTSSVFAVGVGVATKLQLLINNEVAVPGSPTGKTGSIGTPFTAGQIYLATVNATDNFYNIASTAVANVKMTENDPNAVETNIQQDLFSGTTIFSLQFLTASGTGWTVHVSTTSGLQLSDGISTLLPVIAAAPTQILVTVPNQTNNPGNVAASGLSGSITPQVAGTIWIATVTIVDNYYNPVGGVANGNVWFQTTDPYDTDGTTQTLLSGTTAFAVQMFQTGNQSLQVFCAAPTCTYLTGNRHRHSDCGRPDQSRPHSVCREKHISPARRLMHRPQAAPAANKRLTSRRAGQQELLRPSASMPSTNIGTRRAPRRPCLCPLRKIRKRQESAPKIW